MFIDIYFPPGLTIDRDEIQVELERQLGSRGEVVGAGTGEAGSNLDLEIFDVADRTAVLDLITSALADLGVPPETIIATSDTGEKLALSGFQL